MGPLENKIGCIPDLEKEYFVFFSNGELSFKAETK